MWLFLLLIEIENAFVLMQMSLVNMLPWVRAGLSKELDTEIEEIMASLQLPDDSDMEGACQALVRIQFAYR